MNINLQNGLFDGLLESLLSQKRHVDRHMDLMQEVELSRWIESVSRRWWMRR